MIQDALAQIDDPVHISCTSSAGKTLVWNRCWMLLAVCVVTTSVWDPRRLPGGAMSGLFRRCGAAPQEQRGFLG